MSDVVMVRCPRCKGTKHAVIWGSTYESASGVSVSCSQCDGTGKVAWKLQPWAKGGAKPQIVKPEQAWTPYRSETAAERKAREYEERKATLDMWERHDAPLLGAP